MTPRVRTLRVLCAVAMAWVVSDAHASSAYAQRADGVHTLYLVRHGYYDHEDKTDPDVGAALVPLGVAQSRLVASRLLSLPVEFTAIYSSTMTRARETAAVIREDFLGLEVREERILRECTPTTWRADVMAELEGDEARLCEEQLEIAFARFFTPSPERDRHDILVCHGNVIRYLVVRALGVDPKAWLGMAIGNCSLTVVRIAPDGAMKLVMYGDMGHIPPNLQTGSYSGEKDLKVPGK